MRLRYRSQVFAPLGRIDKKRLKRLDLQTIDVFNVNTIYSWCQLRRVLFDVGLGFLKRGEMYLGVIIIYIVFQEILLLSAIYNKDLAVVGVVDFFYTGFFFFFFFFSRFISFI